MGLLIIFPLLVSGYLVCIKHPITTAGCIVLKGSYSIYRLRDWGWFAWSSLAWQVP